MKTRNLYPVILCALLASSAQGLDLVKDGKPVAMIIAKVPITKEDEAPVT